MVFLTVFKVNESPSSLCCLTFPYNSFIQLRWLLISPSVAEPGFDPGKAELHLKFCLSDVYPFFKSSFIFDTLQCKTEGLFICMFFLVELCFSYLAWFHLCPPRPLRIIHIFCSAYLFENNELNTYLHIWADFHFYNIKKEKKTNPIFVCLQLFVSLKWP